MASKKNNAQSIREALVSRLMRGKNGDQINTPFFAVLIVGVLLLIGLVWWVLPGSGPVEPIADVIDQFTEPQQRHPLSGELVDGEVNPAVVAVMVENSLDAWPLSGVEDAFLVYEAPVEGNITRFMLLFGTDQEVDEIGPVRSARPYYVRWANEWNALYAHVGGSPEALELIGDLGVADLNEFYNAASFWRSSARFAPHNTYTSTRRLNEAWERIVGEEVTIAPRLFREGCEECDAPEHSIDVAFNGAAYDVTWIYDLEENHYVRWQNGVRHRSADGDQLSADNVLVLETDMEVIDAVGRKYIDINGPGKGALMSNGDVLPVSWWREESQGQYRLLLEDENGQQVTFVPGVTWIQMVDEERDVIYRVEGENPEIIL